MTYDDDDDDDYTVDPISSMIAGSSLQSTLCLRKEDVTRLFLL